MNVGAIKELSLHFKGKEDYKKLNTVETPLEKIWVKRTRNIPTQQYWSYSWCCSNAWTVELQMVLKKKLNNLITAIANAIPWQQSCSWWITADADTIFEIRVMPDAEKKFNQILNNTRTSELNLMLLKYLNIEVTDNADATLPQLIFRWSWCKTWTVDYDAVHWTTTCIWS